MKCHKPNNTAPALTNITQLFHLQAQRNTFKYHHSVQVSIYAHSRPTYYNARTHSPKTSQSKPYWLSTRLGPQPTLSVCGNICDANGDVWRALGGFDFSSPQAPFPSHRHTHTHTGLLCSLSFSLTHPPLPLSGLLLSSREPWIFLPPCCRGHLRFLQKLDLKLLH